jgi:hemolysin III
MAKSSTENIKQYSVGEEIASSILHGLGIVLGVVGMGILLVFSGQAHDGWRIASSIVYCLAIILEFSASTLYHALTNEKAKRVFKVLDHASIYLLIAGTYTPFCLVTLRSAGGIGLLIFIWAFALVGIGFEAFWVFRPKWVSVVIYLAMGWAIIFSISNLTRLLAPGGIWLLIAGGLAYSLGTIFYIVKKIPAHHAIWHAWVLAGALCHFLAVLLFVII